MKRFGIFLVVLSMALISMAQVEIDFVRDAVEDATLLENGINPCYTLKCGETQFDTDVMTMTAAELKDMLTNDFDVVADANCPEAGDVDSLSLRIEYADGRLMEYPAVQMGNLKNSPAAERLLFDAAKVTITNISFTTTEGNQVTLDDQVIGVKG